MAIDGGPYLVIAAFCEKLLREQDGVISLIRLVDRWQIIGPEEQMPPAFIPLNLVVIFRSGAFRGPAQLTISPITPSGNPMPPINASVYFEGDDDRGAAVATPLAIPVTEPGVYWFELKLLGQAVTQLSMRVVYLRGGPPQILPS